MDILNEKGLFHRLILTASRLEANANRYYFEPMGLTSTYCKMLCLLSKHDGITPTEVMHKIGGTKSNISQRLDVLEKRGWAKRVSKNSGDKRSIRIELTAEGREKHREIKDFMIKKSLYLEQQFTAEEKLHMNTILDKLNQIMDGHDERLKKE